MLADALPEGSDTSAACWAPFNHLYCPQVRLGLTMLGRVSDQASAVSFLPSGSSFTGNRGVSSLDSNPAGRHRRSDTLRRRSPQLLARFPARDAAMRRQLLREICRPLFAGLCHRRRRPMTVLAILGRGLVRPYGRPRRASVSCNGNSPKPMRHVVASKHGPRLSGPFYLTPQRLRCTMAEEYFVATKESGYGKPARNRRGFR